MSVVTSNPLPELTTFLESLAEPHILCDRQYRIVFANAAYRRTCGDQRDVVGRTCYEVSHHYPRPCDEAGESCPLARTLQSGQRERVLHLHHTPRGEAYVNIELSPIRDADGEIVWFIEKMEHLNVARGAGEVSALIGRAPAFQTMVGLLARVAPSDATVLLEGESGSGKELVAQALHEGSRRASRPFIAVDCSGLPETLFESELFGHERGAFTGANVRRAGLIEAASGGTLFLDELGDVPLTMQVKLLRLLETGTYRPVGSTELRRADIRVVSATHRPLRQMVADGRFRQDLYYRLNTFPIRVPALRERVTDIPLLAKALLARVCGNRHLEIAPAAMALLCGYAFPGNVRELRNALERASLLCDGDEILPANLPDEIRNPVAAAVPGGDATQSGLGSADAPASLAPLAAAGQQALREALAAHGGNRKTLARSLGISERTLYRKLRALRGGA